MGDDLNDDAYLLDFDHRLDEDNVDCVNVDMAHQKRQVESNGDVFDKGESSSKGPPHKKKKKKKREKERIAPRGDLEQILNWADPYFQRSSLEAFLVENLDFTDLELSDILPETEKFLDLSEGCTINSVVAAHTQPGWKLIDAGANCFLLATP